MEISICGKCKHYSEKIFLKRFNWNGLLYDFYFLCYFCKSSIMLSASIGCDVKNDGIKSDCNETIEVLESDLPDSLKETFAMVKSNSIFEFGKTFPFPPDTMICYYCPFAIEHELSAWNRIL